MLNILEGKNKEEPNFRHLIKTSFDMIVLLDADGNQQFVSESCKQIIGFDVDELNGINVIDEMIHPNDVPNVKKVFQNILDTLGTGDAQYRHKHKNGGWVYLEAYGSNQLNNPTVNAILLNVRDITKRKETEKALKKSEQQLRELNATKDRFLSIISHDLRTPFSGILGISDLVLKMIDEGEYKELPEMVTHIKESAEQAYHLLENLLEWSRTQSGKIHFEPVEMDLNQSINEVMSLLSETARDKSISFTSCLSHRVWVKADKNMVETVLRNLLSNAIKFTNSGGHIQVSIKRKENSVIVSIKDNGIGIPSEKLDSLFEICHSRSTFGTKNESGSGLGLLLCKEFIDLHNQKIWVESELGSGSTFYFTLPACKANTSKLASGISPNIAKNLA